MPKGDMAFMRHLAKKMSWTVSESNPTSRLYDPESGAYLNEETMRAVRDVESGKVQRCKDMSELLNLI